MVTLTASNPLDAWSGSAPTAARPARTTTKALVNPTSAETTPAEIGENTPLGADAAVTRRPHAADRLRPPAPLDAGSSRKCMMFLRFDNRGTPRRSMSLIRSTPVTSGYASRNVKNTGTQRFVLARLFRSDGPR
ncbi:hypothetical protein GCM10022224_094670 [Nonomuraea antimicrobica]|uniref:Uncharacterized protein n=1 Tax=Nonomuraea antimicrobica TaxID=561173 RepID=A0ABP7E5P4_9ACTN